MAAINADRPARFLQPTFVAAAVLMLAAAVVRGPVAKSFQLAQKKLPVPLRKALNELDKNALGQYQFALAHHLDQAVVASLVTDTFINWQFVDTTVRSSFWSAHWMAGTRYANDLPTPVPASSSDTPPSL